VNPALEDDVLARSVRALRREQITGPAPVVPLGDDAVGGREHTWNRIATDVRRARVVRRWTSIAALQLALGLCGATVWGAATGRLQPAVRAAAAAVRALASPAHRARSAPRRPATSVGDVGSGALPPPVTLAPPPPVTEPVTSPPMAAPRTPPATPVHRAARVITPAPAPRSGGASTGQTGAADKPAAEAHALLVLYREAHRLHFVEHDFAGALGAWDRYLAAGSGPLAVEARYNRAIALARLGRREEAIAALRPFAEGESGSYRRQEALGLIEALRRGADPQLRDP
jgi:hypothetical protein